MSPSAYAATYSPVLSELTVENLLLIERAQLRLAPGLNVLTGETGAGKTMLAHALDLLLGGRVRTGSAASTLVRPGANEAYVEGAFECSDLMRAQLGERLPADAEQIVLARRVDADGRRTRAYLNGRSVTVADLREIGGRLVAFYGQHEHRKLMLTSAQLQILDELCGPEQRMRLRACARAYRESSHLQARLAQLQELTAARGRELELLEHELQEIEGAVLERSEHDRLLAVRERLRRLDALCGAAGAGAQALAPESGDEPGAVESLARASIGLDGVAGVDPALDALAERLRTIVVESQDLAGELRDYGETLTGEDGSLEEIEQQLAVTERLMRKYGGSIEEVLAYAERARARREELDDSEGALKETAMRLGDACAELERCTVALRDARRAAAPRLAKAVHEQLVALAMPGAEFDVVLTERAPGPDGGDGVEMLLAPNPGVPSGPLREIASGGELSRVMLAVITASMHSRESRTSGDRQAASTASGDPAESSAPGEAGGPVEEAVAGGGIGGSGVGEGAASTHPETPATLVFDEIDAGIGGHTARAVGERLRTLSEGRQILCITHLPQIASLGARHFAIVKDISTTDTASTTVVQLGEPEVVSELVRMLGAPDTDKTARAHAEDLRKAA
jgi:DNA repair protein RecN (Recombination protein N)